MSDLYPAPELLTTEQLRNFVIAQRYPDLLVPLGLVHAPPYLLSDYRATPCELHGMLDPDVEPPSTEPLDVVRHLNEHYFWTRGSGLSEGLQLWTLDTLGRAKHPVLYPAYREDFIECYGKATWNFFQISPHRRYFERVCLTPMVESTRVFHKVGEDAE